jgi:hypothetical protein
VVDSVRVCGFNLPGDAEPMKDGDAFGSDEFAAEFIAGEFLALKKQDANTTPGKTNPSRRPSRSAADDDNVVLHFFPTMTTR